MSARPLTVRDLYADVLFDRSQEFTREITHWLPPMRCVDHACVFTFTHTDEVCAPYSNQPTFAVGGKVASPKFRDGANVMPR